MIWIIYTPNTDHLACKLFTCMQCVCHVYTKIQLCSWIVYHNIDTWKMQRRKMSSFVNSVALNVFSNLGLPLIINQCDRALGRTSLRCLFLGSLNFYTLFRWNIVELGVWWTLHFLFFVFFFLSCFRNVHFVFKSVDTYGKLMATIVLFLQLS